MFGPVPPRIAQQISNPAAGRVLIAEAEDGGRDWHPDEGAEQPPQEGPKEDREQHDHWRHRQHASGDARLNIIADYEL